MNTMTKFDFISKEIKKTMRKMGIPGVAFGIYHQGEIQTASFGVTNLNHPLPITPQTLFPIGAITKTFTAILAMRLVKSNKLDLDKPIIHYLPDFKMQDVDVMKNLTMRHLLTHTGGWAGDYYQEQGEGDDALAKVVADLVKLPQEFPLGTLFSFNNSGFYLAGRVIEVLYQQPFETAMQENIFQPLGLDNTYFFPRDFYSQRISIGHFQAADEPIEVVSRYGCTRMANPAGGIVTSLNDLLRYAQLYLQKGKNYEGNRILSLTSIAELLTPTVTIYTHKNNQQRMALSWFLNEIDGIKIYSNAGGLQGQCALLVFVPEQDFAFVLLNNLAMSGKFFELISTQIHLQYLGITQTTPKAKVWPTEFLTAYLGTYVTKSGEKFIIERKGKHLQFQFYPSEQIHQQLKYPPKHVEKLPPIDIGLVNEDIWVALGNDYPGLRGEFISDEKGDITWFRSGRLAKKVKI
ncbi:MAG: beta-lactamase family protein [Gammaproteobacteria bacterium]|nr:beta-lactamase family protein [Gammaproteobacteria bacterium]